MGILLAGIIGGLRTVFGMAAISLLILPANYNDNGKLLFSLMIGGVISGLVVTKFTSYKNIISQPQDGPAILISIFAATLALNNEQQDFAIPIILASVALSSIITGVLFYVIGYKQLGKLVRYIPYPVIGGFLAGSGLLISISSFSILANQKLADFNVEIFKQDDHELILIVGIIIALLLFKVPSYFKSKLVFPLLLLFSTLLLHLYFWHSHISIKTLQDLGWLSTIKKGSDTQEAYLWFNIPLNQWNYLIQNILTFASISIVSIIGILLNLSGLEISTRIELNFNRELKFAGIANMIGGIFGGTVNFPSLSASLIGQQMKVESRWIGYTSYLVIVLVIFIGPQILGLLPKPILGGILLCVGIHLLDEWIIKGFKRFSIPDYITIVSIAISMEVAGYLFGIGIGIFLCVAFFVWNYSLVKVITLEVSGIYLRSNVERSIQEKELLDQYGNELLLLKIEGFLFFGTAYSVYDRIQQLILDGTHYLILDMAQVKSIDSSALSVFRKISEFCKDHSCEVVITRLNQNLQHLIKTHDKEGFNFIINSDRDLSLEYCENLIIVKYSNQFNTEVHDIWSSVLKYVEDENLFPIFKSYFHLQTCKKDDYLIKQNDPGNEMYLVHSGRFSIFIEPDSINLHPIRLKAITSGSIFGEMALFSSLKRSASVKAEVDSQAYVLTRAKLNEMQQKYPYLGNALQRVIINMMSERLMSANRLIRRLDS